MRKTYHLPVHVTHRHVVAPLILGEAVANTAGGGDPACCVTGLVAKPATKVVAERWPGGVLKPKHLVQVDALESGVELKGGPAAVGCERRKGKGAGVREKKTKQARGRNAQSESAVEFY
tara:strand:+ start:109 stop:465 length:357 start_codon:yes stop_codon:yes gene_type:complete